MPLYGEEFGGEFGSDPDSWGEYENALRLWLVTATGVTVIRSYQDGPRPSDPFVHFAITRIDAIGAADSLQNFTDVPGDTVIEVVRGVREIAVLVQAHTASAVGPSAARALLAKAQVALRSSVVKETLHNAGMTCFDAGSIQVVPVVLDTRWEGRAALTCRFYVEEIASADVGYIETVEIKKDAPPPAETYILGVS